MCYREEAVANFKSRAYCRAAVINPCLFLVVRWVGLWFVIVAFRGHTHLHFIQNFTSEPLLSQIYFDIRRYFDSIMTRVIAILPCSVKSV